MSTLLVHEGGVRRGRVRVWCRRVRVWCRECSTFHVNSLCQARAFRLRAQLKQKYGRELTWREVEELGRREAIGIGDVKTNLEFLEMVGQAKKALGQ
jgi:hypothetical protein